MKLIRNISLVFIAFILILLGVIRFLYGGGEAFVSPLVSSESVSNNLEIVAEIAEAPGNIAVSKTGRIFITLHPEAKPEFAKVVEIKDGKMIPFPDLESQKDVYHSPQGIRIDSQNRLWTIDHGDNGIHGARLVAVDLDTNKIIDQFDFPKEIAGLFSYLQDLVIEPNGRYIFIADVNFFGKSPALIVYDSKLRKAKRLLENDESVKSKDYIIQAYNGPMVRLFGLIAMKPGADSIGLDSKAEYLYYAPMTHDRLFRIPVAALIDESLSSDDLKEKVENYAPKILSDGITLDDEDNVYLTDVENRSIVQIDTKRNLKISVQSPKLRWPDGLSWGPDGYLYIADSDIPDLVLASRIEIKKAAPFYIFRYKPGKSGRIGH
jgi:sugar lactone lactonase YvrE